MPNKSENMNSEEKLPDRPLECSDCKKPLAVHYSEIVEGTVTNNCMCADCPVLEKHLFGLRSSGASSTHTPDGATGLACGNCGTTLEALRVGTPLGCSSCYEVFEELIIEELLSVEKIPARLASSKKLQPLHIGRIQGPSQKISSSMRILALNEALNETLQREDYEQAAFLRDQIKALTDLPEPSEEKETSENKGEQNGR